MISKVRTISPILRRVRNPFTAPWSMMRMMWKNPRLLGLPVYLEPVAPSCHWFLILFRNNPDTDDCWILLGIFQIQHSPYEHFESSEWLVSAYSRVILLMEEIPVSTDSYPFDVALSWNERSLSFQALLSLWTNCRYGMIWSQTYTFRFPGWPPSQVGCALGTSVHLHNSASRLPMKVESKITFVKVFFQRLMTAFDGREPGIHETLVFLLIELKMLGLFIE